MAGSFAPATRWPVAYARWCGAVPCRTRGRTNWQLVRDQSVFVDWQRVKVQENVDEVRQGLQQDSCQGVAWAA